MTPPDRHRLRPEELGNASQGLAYEEPLLFERSRPGRVGFSLPGLDVPPVAPEDVLPAEFLRGDCEGLPELSEVDVVRHFTRISTWNYAVDLGLYPLGSCTMKYNPKLNEAVASLPGFARTHPLQPTALAQGLLQLFHQLEGHLAEISGMDRVSLQPAAGAQGELAGVMMIRAHHEQRGERRTKILVPDSAHGTNPASAGLNGYEIVSVASGADGLLHPEAVAAAMGPSVAALMLTNPSTLGLFEEHIVRIAEIVHAGGGLVYGDGANLNALLGVARPGDLGIDVMHFTLHKTFSTPHGGGGPGAGPVGVKNLLAPYLPVPVVRKLSGSEGDGFALDYEFPHSIGRLHGNFGNVGMLVRAFAYIRTLGPDGLRRCAEMAVLNANYLLARLRTLGVCELLPATYDRLCMHEFVLSGAPAKERLGVRTLDLAKRLLDHGYHPPTVYFPLLVEEAMLIEPTETETRETLDGFAEALAEILAEAREDPEIARGAPYSTPVRRLDEAGAARVPVLRQPL